MSPEASWKKSSAASVERFDAALPDHPALERRKMFGYAACFVNGHYCTGLYQDRFVIRLPGDIRDRFPELAEAVPFDPMGTEKGMKNWYEIPEVIVADDARLADLLAATVDEVAMMPPKAAKKRR
ncbi:MAG: TfoX/Sxy family protein [Chloroflexota bacterium]|nr:TfoX/Sxy family protein [Chloroflexota bacterium]